MPASAFGQAANLDRSTSSLKTARKQGVTAPCLVPVSHFGTLMNDSLATATLLRSKWHSFRQTACAIWSLLKIPEIQETFSPGI
jgi:hypothetical protein